MTHIRIKKLTIRPFSTSPQVSSRFGLWRIGLWALWKTAARLLILNHTALLTFTTFIGQSAIRGHLRKNATSCSFDI